MKKIALIVFIAITSISNGQDLNTKIDSYLHEITVENGIPGIALAVIKNGEIIYKKYYGYANLDYEIPVSDKTKFPLFSTTKIFSTVAVHHLIQKNKLQLADKISKYLTDLPTKWQEIQIKNLLTHSSGLPEIVVYSDKDEKIAKSKVYKDSIKFKKGYDFDYNQTNFWLLDRIVEKVTNTSLPNYILQTQFDPNTTATFDGNSKNIVKNRATSYSDYPAKGYLREEDYKIPKYLFSGSGFSLTLNEFIEWDKKFDNNKLINKEAKKRLFQPFDFVEGRLYSYGWYMDETNGFKSYYYSGSFSTGYKKYIDKDLTIIFLTNGSKELLKINKIMKNIAGIIDKDLIEKE